MAVNLPRLRLHLALAMISAAVIAYQLALMQILSVVQWHHFAYMIIAVALLGFGAAGACISLTRPWLMRRFSALLPLALCLSGAMMAVMTVVAQSSWARFDSLLLFTGLSQFLRLLVTYGLYFLPFFLAALAIGMIFVHAAGDIGRLYFWNLTGSGAGALAMTGLLWLFPPPLLPGLVALAAVAAATLVLPEGLRMADLPRDRGSGAGALPSPERIAAGQSAGAPGRHSRGRWRMALGAAAVLSGLAAVFSLIHPPALVLSEFKGLSRAMHLPEARITHERGSPYGLMQIYSSPALRYAPGLSLVYQERIPVRKAVFNNGEWFGAIVPGPEEAPDTFLDHTTGALPYALGTRRRVLILDAGTGSLISQALSRGAQEVTAVEPHPVILSFLREELARETGNLLAHPAVSIRNLSSRTFLFLDRSQYDLILLPTVDAFGGASGLQALREQYLLTREAFRQIWRKLTPQGAVGVTAWMDYPLRHPLKIISTLAEVLEEEGITDVRAHLAAVRGWGTVTILAKKSPLTAAETDKIRRFCEDLLFDPALLPDLREEERMRFNGLQDGRFFLYLDKILSPQRELFYADYAFNIRPATDDRPYFSQFLRLPRIPDLAGVYGTGTFPFLEAGYLLVLLTLLQVAIIAAVLIILPLRFLRREGGCRMGTLLYFGGLGLGYMFVEIVLIQRFLLYFGNTVHAAAAVISGMLVCSGIGSLLSRRVITKRAHALTVLVLIVLLILLYALLLTPVLQATITLPPAAKLAFSLILIAPAALVMGMPFPLGIRLLAGKADQGIPWAWGINGCLSVVGTVLAAVIAVELGFVWVMILAAFSYGTTLISGWTGLLRPEAFRGYSR
ncbi:MAG: RsmD family RNA methyltransferase [Proteobacteria bacterium]|nr:RsmD family RNA methyltransferase [Pseudomonadota bacterium]